MPKAGVGIRVAKWWICSMYVWLVSLGCSGQSGLVHGTAWPSPWYFMVDSVALRG